MKTTATAVVWRRVLSVCLLCALWGEGTVRATGESPESSNVDGLLKTAEEAEGSAAGAVGAQTTVVEKLKEHFPLLEDKAKKVTEAANKINEAEVKEALDAIESVRSEAKELNETAQGLMTLVGEAEKKSKEVVEEAKRLAGEKTDAGDMSKKTAAVKRAASEAVELWRELARKAASQSSEATRLLEKVKTTMTTVRTTALKVGNSSDQKRTNVADALEELMTPLNNIINDPRNPDILAKAAEKAVNAASAAAANTKKATGASSSDGSPLTVSCLAATSVLLLFASLGIVMISA